MLWTTTSERKNYTIGGNVIANPVKLSGQQDQTDSLYLSRVVTSANSHEVANLPVGIYYEFASSYYRGEFSYLRLIHFEDTFDIINNGYYRLIG